MSKSLLFISQTQFGYLIDYMKYCKYLKNDFDIVFLCWDHGSMKLEEKGIEIQYISRKGNIIIRNLRFIKEVIKYINTHKPNFVFIDYFKGSSLLPLYCIKNSILHLDIRTGSVSDILFYRKINNNLLRMECKFYRSISVISVGLQKALGIKKDVYILPLGATPMYLNRLKKEKVHLIYVGTLTNRKIEYTLEGLKLFLEKYPNADIYYTIIGNGWNNESEDLIKTVNHFKLEDKVNFTGYVPHAELKHFYENATVGVSFIPMTSYYDYQPATKTYEYLMAGIPVIATKTNANKQVITQNNGVLINDNAESFADGIATIYHRVDLYDEKIIRQTVESYDWANIINSMKRSILQ